MAEDLLDVDAVMEEEVVVEKAEAVVESVDDNPFAEEPKDGKAEKAVSAVEHGDVARPMPGVDLDFSFLGDIKGAEAVQTGTVISRFPVERLKFTTQQRVLLSFLSDSAIKCNTHYIDGVGQFFCNGSDCCKLDPKGGSTTKIVYPVFVYGICDKSGKVKEKILKNYVLAVGRNTYSTICNLAEIHGGLTTTRFMVVCSDAMYQKIELIATGPSLWQSNEKVAAEIQKFWKENQEHMLDCIGRHFTDEELRKRLEDAGITTGADTGSFKTQMDPSVDMNALFE